MIETIYKGYKFRSRLKARWAVFFDALNIDYRYEIEKFDLDGLPCLPDFWLPTQQYWIEIKDQEPTEEEQEKATLLSLYTGKPVYTFWGDIWIPDKNTKSSIGRKEVNIDGMCADSDDAYRRLRAIGEEFEKREDAFYYDGDDGPCDAISGSEDFHFHCFLYPLPLTIEALFYQLSKEDISLRSSKGKLYIDMPLGTPTCRSLELIKTHEQELIEVLSAQHDGWRWGVSDIDTCMRNWWCECPECSALGIAPWGHANRLPCRCIHTQGEPSHQTPRLIAAYTAARQARFEDES